jgi:uncharacterized beta-barrel protein YwiB (DUF1934 family)
MSAVRPIEIRIRSKQTAVDGSATEEAELTVLGLWQEEDDETCLAFSEALEEQAVDGAYRGHSSIRINRRGEVFLKRRAAVSTEMHFIPGSRSLQQVESDYGVLEMMTLTTDVVHQADASGGQLRLAYLIDYLNGEQADMELMITYNFSFQN